MTTTITVTPSPVRPNVPLWLSGHQCPRVEYNPTSEYKLKKGEKTGWGVICQFTSRSQKEMNAIYVGGLEDRRAEGYGEWHSEEERMSYHGGWKDNVASGYGRYSDSWTVDWPDSWARFLPGDADSTPKFTYEGGFKDGFFHGYGTLTFKDKSKYEGTWKEGRRWGYGKYTKDDGGITEFQVEGAIKPAEKKEEKKEEKKDEKKEDKKDTSPQYIYVQPQPQILQPVIQQPLVQVSQPHEHSANAGVAFTWGHGAQQQQPSQPTYVYAQPLEARPVTPQPIPVQYTVGSPPRPLTPHGRQGSQSYIVTVPPNAQPATTGGLPYPEFQNISLGGSPPNTVQFPHM